MVLEFRAQTYATLCSFQTQFYLGKLWKITASRMNRKVNVWRHKSCANSLFKRKHFGVWTADAQDGNRCQLGDLLSAQLVQGKSLIEIIFLLHQRLMKLLRCSAFSNENFKIKIQSFWNLLNSTLFAVNSILLPLRRHFSWYLRLCLTIFLNLALVHRDSLDL